MKIFPKVLRLVLPVYLAIALAGCSSPAASPTPDQASLVKAIVATMDAQLIQTEMAKPTATLVPTQTETPLPTNTLPPTDTPVPSLTPIPSPTSEFVDGIAAKVVTVGTYPDNKREYNSNVKFDLVLRFKNVGTITWVGNYYVKILSFQGTLTAWPDLKLGKSIATGEVAEFDIPAFGAEQMGKHTWVYQLYTENGLPVRGGVAVFTYTAI